MKKLKMLLVIGSLTLSQAVVGGSCLPGQDCGIEVGECLAGQPCSTEEIYSDSSELSYRGETCNIGTVDDYFYGAECLPGQPGCRDKEVFYSTETVDEIVERVRAEEKEKFGGVDDFFAGTKDYYDYNTVVNILNRCRSNPQSCGIDALLIGKTVTPKSKVIESLANRTLAVKGYYLNYGDDQFDWVYVTPYKSVYKLEKGIGPDYTLQWSVIQTPEDPAFSNIQILNGYVKFGYRIK
ncbi:MAG: hypothetical protein GXO61_02930 [Epsilonproteobacteria bacterium]|nr:hypothetical protein [Campylobacterota bacterium]